MSPQHRARPRLYVLLVGLCLVPGLTILAALPWLKQQPVGVLFLWTGIAGAVAILGSLVLGIVHDRGMDEWERSNARFASFWGDAAGTSLVALLLLLPAGREWIIAVVTNWADASRPDQLVFLGFALGFAALVLARVACMAALSIGWSLWKSRAVREPS
ncbi:MAG: hypothetical protein ABUS57_05525 [Pseudomonadota bacterium]